ncbi:peptide ABC transporter substrate-binding protein [Jiella sp. MQZ9-1]|uniref:Peptide ABC transporter substrate-binding protein n=1 Tax=Jiella flava TaxID=2816857 RepID=A0A939FYM8_9HYPH|nr:peptide ABC transporter substrate-binding protein [Jiella flava]MBO0662605.1 peptide ABC transporter substrate-binding protein [Jiella flava]MCD2471027.1 peptide ABC transporter substrate-binding protein [Jiella flava]
MNFSFKTFTGVVVLSTLLAFGSAEARDLVVYNGGDVTSLDPQKISGDWEDRVDGDIFEGLFTEDAEAKPILGVAKSYETSKDGLTWTFKLRDDAKWSDGQPVTAEDFVFAFQRLMDPKTASEYAYIQYPIKNAEAINTGKIKDFSQLGVKALDDKTLEITLEHPIPYYRSLLCHFTAYPLPKHLIDKVGDDWVKIGNIVTDGPYKPVEWVPGSHVLTAKNPYWPGKDKLDIDGVRFLSMEDNAAGFRRYQAGEIDIMTAYPKDQYTFIQKNLPGQGHFTPFAGLYYYLFNEQKPPFDDKRVREALSKAIYREVIGPKVLTSGEPAAFGWVPPGMDNYPKEGARFKWAKEPYPQRVKEAKALLKEAGYGPDHPLDVTLSYNTSDNHKRIAIAIAAMWKPLGVNVKLVNAEVKVHYANLREGDFQVARAGWLADFNDPINFLDLLKGGNEMNYGKWNNKEYNALLKQASTESDLKKRATLLKQAEQIALDDDAAMPIYFYLSENLVSPKVKGFKDNVFDKHRTRWLSLDK